MSFGLRKKTKRRSDPNNETKYSSVLPNITTLGGYRRVQRRGARYKIRI